MIAFACRVVRYIQHAPSILGAVGAGSMRHIGVKKYGIAGLHFERVIWKAVLWQGFPVPSKRNPAVLVVGHFKASICHGTGIDRDHRRDIDTGIALPAGLHVLVCAKAVCARQLEVDLVFKEDRGLAQQTCGNCAQYADVKQFAEPLMVGLKVLQACENALVGLGHVIFVVFHPHARYVGPSLNLVVPRLQLREPIAREQAGNQGISM